MHQNLAISLRPFTYGKNIFIVLIPDLLFDEGNGKTFFLTQNWKLIILKRRHSASVQSIVQII